MKAQLAALAAVLLLLSTASDARAQFSYREGSVWGQLETWPAGIGYAGIDVGWDESPDAPSYSYSLPSTIYPTSVGNFVEASAHTSYTTESSYAAALASAHLAISGPAEETVHFIVGANNYWTVSPNSYVSVFAWTSSVTAYVAPGDAIKISGRAQWRLSLT
jgi:hypothetical protein